MLIRCHESGTGSVACSSLVILCQIRRKGGYKVIFLKKIHDNMKVDAPPTDTAPPAVLVQNYSMSMNLVECPVCFKTPCFSATIPTPTSTLLACLYCERGQMEEEPRKGGSSHGVSGQASSHDWVLGRQPKSLLGGAALMAGGNIQLIL